MAGTGWGRGTVAVRRSCKRFAAVARIRSVLRIAAAAVALVASSATVLPAQALTTASNTTYCSGTMTLTFTTPLTIFPAARNFSLSGSGTCAGLSSGPASWSSLGMTATDATCEAIAAQGGGTFTVPTESPSVSMTVAGPTAVESWTFLDSGGMNTLQASGVFAWENLAQIQSCLGSGTLSVTLNGSFVVVT